MTARRSFLGMLAGAVVAPLVRRWPEAAPAVQPVAQLEYATMDNLFLCDFAQPSCPTELAAAIGHLAGRRRVLVGFLVPDGSEDYY